ncbi:MAG: hypothetical protein OXC15_12680, partial [Rhodospirillaceae bacterium]|nr:hypothetical protein [Rhodospirillaceae bacterium]
DDTIENALDMFLSVSGMTHSPHLRTSDPAAITKQTRRVANNYRQDNESSVWIAVTIVSIPETPHAANPAAARPAASPGVASSRRTQRPVADLDDVRPLTLRPVVVRYTREGKLWNESIARYHYLV